LREYRLKTDLYLYSVYQKNVDYVLLSSRTLYPSQNLLSRMPCLQRTINRKARQEVQTEYVSRSELHHRSTDSIFSKFLTALSF